MKRARTAARCAVILAIITCLLLTGCRKQTPAPETDPLPVLKIGSDEYAPYFFIDEDGTYAGIDVELAIEACRRIGYTAELHRINWQTKDTSLKNGEIDCLWGSFSMSGREDRYIWAGPYMTSRQVVAVRSDSTIESLADLADKRIGVQASAKPDELFSDTPNGNIPKIRYLYCFSTINNVFAALRKGYVDAIAGHETAFREFMKLTPDSYRILEEPLLEVNLGVAFLLGSDGELAEKLTEALHEMQEDGFTAAVLMRYGLDPERANTK